MREDSDVFDKARDVFFKIHPEVPRPKPIQVMDLVIDEEDAVDILRGTRKIVYGSCDELMDELYAPVQISFNIFISTVGKTRALLLQDEKALFPEVIGVGRSIPSAIADYVACFNEKQAGLPEGERVTLSTSDLLPSKRVVKRFPDLWSFLGADTLK